MTPIEAAEEILRCIDYITKTYPENYDRIGELDKELCDIQHIIEFTPLDIQRGFRLAKQTQEVRKERRVLKNENEVLKPLYDFFNQGSRQAFKNALIVATSKAKSREKMLSDRVYGFRSQAFQPPEQQEVDG